MISKLAEEVHAGWMRERLQPTLRMCVDLNAAGLAVERGPMASGFYSVPRVAYLGDFVFREPTVRRLAYMEDLRALLDGDEETQFLAAAYALHVPEADLVPLDSRRRARKAVSRFAVEVLADFSLSQAVAAVSYALTGADPDEVTGDYSGGKAESPADVPRHCRSYARELLASAVGSGFDAKSAGELTAAALERVLSAAALTEGEVKRRDADAVGRFWQIAGKCRSEMLAARDGRAKGGGNGGE